MVTTSTCIVGIKHNGIVYIGCDSMAGNSDYGFISNNKKIFHVQNRAEIVCGYTTSFRMGQLIQYSDSLFNEDDFLIDGRIDEKYMVNVFVPNLQNLFSKGGFEEVINNYHLGGTFLLGYRDKLFLIQNDYSVLESVDDYMACGCGESYALASLYTTEDCDMSVDCRIKKALESAAKYSYGVSAPFYITDTFYNSIRLLK